MLSPKHQLNEERLHDGSKLPHEADGHMNVKDL
jgi:hypothetical protein